MPGKGAPSGGSAARDKLHELRWALGCADWRLADGLYLEIEDAASPEGSPPMSRSAIQELATYVHQRDREKAIELVDSLLVQGL